MLLDTVSTIEDPAHRHAIYPPGIAPFCCTSCTSCTELLAHVSHNTRCIVGGLEVHALPAIAHSCGMGMLTTNVVLFASKSLCARRFTNAGCCASKPASTVQCI